MPKGTRNSSVTYEGKSYKSGSGEDYVSKAKFTSTDSAGRKKVLGGLTNEFATDEEVSKARADVQRKIGENGKKALLKKMDEASKSTKKGSFKGVSVTQGSDDFSEAVEMVKKKKTASRSAY